MDIRKYSMWLRFSRIWHVLTLTADINNVSFVYLGTHTNASANKTMCNINVDDIRSSNPTHKYKYVFCGVPTMFDNDKITRKKKRKNKMTNKHK